MLYVEMSRACVRVYKTALQNNGATDIQLMHII